MQCNLRLFLPEIKQRKINLLCIFYLQSPPTISHPLCTSFDQVLHIWYLVNCLDLPPPQLCTLYIKKLYTTFIFHFIQNSQENSFDSYSWKNSVNSLIALKSSSRFAGKESVLMTLPKEVVMPLFMWRQSSS